MKTLEMLLAQPWVQHLGWTLVQFLWQGTLIAIAFAIVRGLLGRVLSPQGRYILACGTLALMALAPVLTFTLMPRVNVTPLTAWPLTSVDAWQPIMPWLVAMWFAGVIAFSLRLIGSWRVTARLRSIGTYEAPPEWEDALERLIRRIGVSRPVRLLISTLVEVPTVVGSLRPVVLVPVRALTGLAPGHINALLAHELAHIRRLDYVVNILQSVAEAVLFYHPAVWWVSEQIRADRELCCDDVAVAASGDILTYAQALAQIESFRPAHAKTALAANGGSLLNRIRRLAGQAPASHNLPSPGAALAMSLLWLAGMGAVVAHGAPVPQLQVPRQQVATPAPAAPLPQLALNRRPVLSTLLFSPYGPAPTPEPAPQAPPAPAKPDPKPEELASIEGTVTNDSTAEPLAKVAVTLRGQPSQANPLPSSYGAVTNAQGKFAVRGSPAGSYMVFVSRNGFLSAYYDEKPSQPRGSQLTLTASQNLTGVDFKLKPQGVITGRVFNADGEPVASMAVAPMQPRQVGGKQQLMPVASQLTNDLGEFRLFGLPAGRYYLQTVNRNGVQTGLDRSKTPIQEGYTDTYYPGTIDVQTAVAVEVTAGHVTQSVEIRMPKVRIARIRGKIENLTGITGTPIAVTMVPADNPVGWVPIQATPAPDGQFELSGVAPGSYSVAAEMRLAPGRTITASRRVDVNGEPVDNVAITLSQPLQIPGNVRAEPGGDSTINLQTLTLMLRPPGPFTVSEVPPTTKPAENGDFTLGPQNPGRYMLTIDPLPKGYYIKSARMGNMDVQENGADLTAGIPGKFEIVLSPKAGTVTGTIKDEQGLTVGSATVVLVPDSPSRRTQSQWYKSTAADASGAFTLNGLAPGDYKLFSWAQVESSAWMNPDVLRPIESRGVKVRVEESTSQQVELKAIPKE